MKSFNPLDLLNLTVAVASALAAFMAAFFSYMFARSTRDKSEIHYNELLRRAELSEMRAAFERQIADLSIKLTATEGRWKDANHLLISSQEFQPAVADFTRPVYSNFLRSMGLVPADLEIDPLLVFVLTPFGQEYRESYDSIARVCSSAGLKCVRGDEEMASGDILSHIMRTMVKARIVIANVSSRNPNVYYELGLSHALDKTTILVSQNIEGVPFDIKSQRILLFDSDDSLVRGLLPIIARTLGDPRKSLVPPS